MKTFHAETLREWREWLDGHHATEREVWLVFYKAHTGRASIGYQDALDEALCFGWIDSLVKRLDGRRFARKFTPRKPDSRWSATNRKRYAELGAEGRLKPSGIERAPTGRTYGPKPRIPTKVPEYIVAALRRHPAARRHFEALPLSERRNFVVWIHIAKREDTRARRLKEALRLLAAGKRLGLK